MTDYPEGTILIEIRDIYDGCSVAKLPNGEFVNLWPPGDRRHTATQEWIDRIINDN